MEWVLDIGFSGTYSESDEKWVKGKSNKAFLNFWPIFFSKFYSAIFNFEKSSNMAKNEEKSLGQLEIVVIASSTLVLTPFFHCTSKTQKPGFRVLDPSLNNNFDYTIPSHSISRIEHVIFGRHAEGCQMFQYICLIMSCN